MKICELHIENFGTLHDFSLVLERDIASVCRENGFGKTTLAAFIKAMFYGMAKKGNNKAYKVDRSRYKPWQGGVYGGSLIFECAQGKFKVARTFDDTPEGDTFELIDLKTGLKSEKFSRSLGYDLFKVGIETFEITAFFPQLDIVSSINDEVRASLTGANKFENDLADFALAQKNIGNKMRELKKELIPKAELEQLENSIHKAEAKLASLKSEQIALEKTIEKLGSESVENGTKLKKLQVESEEVKLYNAEKARLENEVFEIQNKLTELFTIDSNASALTQVETKKNSKVWNILTLGVGVMLLIALAVLCATKILGLTLTVALGAIVIAICVGVVMFLSRQKQPARQNTDLKDVNNDKLLLLKGQLALKKEELKSFSKEKTFDEERLKNVEARKFEIEKEISIAELNFSNVTAAIDDTIEQLEEVEGRLETKRIQDEKARESLKLIEKTLEFMKTAQEKISVRFMTPMQTSFEKYFKKLSSKEIKLDVNFDANLQTAVGGREEEYLSQGYRDIVSVCKRLALIENIYKEENPFIIMDDPFVNLDKANFDCMREILHEFAKDYQIIYLNCHEKTNI